MPTLHNLPYYSYSYSTYSAFDRIVFEMDKGLISNHLMQRWSMTGTFLFFYFLHSRKLEWIQLSNNLTASKCTNFWMKSIQFTVILKTKSMLLKCPPQAPDFKHIIYIYHVLWDLFWGWIARSAGRGACCCDRYVSQTVSIAGRDFRLLITRNEMINKSQPKD